MLINLGRLLILYVWGFLLFNLFHPLSQAAEVFHRRGAILYGGDAWLAIDVAKSHPADQLLAGNQDLHFRSF